MRVTRASRVGFGVLVMVFAAACSKAGSDKPRQGVSVVAAPSSLSAPAAPSAQEARLAEIKNVVPPHPVPPLTLKPSDQEKFEKAHAQFAWSLYRRFVESRAEENLVYSPIAVQFALGMLVLSSRGAGENRLARIAAPGMPADRIYDAMQSWQEQLLRSMNGGSSNGSAEVGTLKFGNAIWLDDSVAPSSSFVDKFGQYYGFGVFRVPLRAESDPGTRAINHWLNEQTDGRVVHLVQGLDRNESALITSLAYLRTPFRSPFGALQSQPFHVSKGSPTSVEMMRNILRARFVRNPAFQAVELELVYGATSLISVMPAAGTLPAFARGLSPAKWNQLLATLQHSTSTIDLYWPKLQIRTRYDQLRDVLSLGAAPLELPYLSRGARLSTLLHEATLAIGQEGIEVPSAAGTVAQNGAAPSSDDQGTQVVKFDRPFLFAVVHRLTGAILLAGQVVAP